MRVAAVCSPSMCSDSLKYFPLLVQGTGQGPLLTYYSSHTHRVALTEKNPGQCHPGSAVDSLCGAGKVPSVFVALESFPVSAFLHGQASSTTHRPQTAYVIMQKWSLFLSKEVHSGSLPTTAEGLTEFLTSWCTLPCTWLSLRQRTTERVSWGSID